MATELKGLRIEEISGVDSPANEVPGWLLMKSKDILSEVHEVHQELDQALDTSETYLGDAPEDVQAAAGTLRKWLGQVLKKSNTPIGPPKIHRNERTSTDMITKEELNAILDERDESLLKALTDRIEEFTKSLEVVEPPADEPVVDHSEELTELKTSIETIAKAVEEDGAALREVLVKMLDRIEALEERPVVRKSILDQEMGEDGKPKQTSVGAALQAVAKGATVTLT